MEGGALFEFYKSCSTIGSMYNQPLATMLVAAKERFPFRGLAEINLVISHRRRVSLNKRCQKEAFERLAPKEYLELLAQPSSAANAPQDMILWLGFPLIAVLDGISKIGIYNSQQLEVMGWDESTVSLRCSEGGREYKVAKGFVSQNCRPGFCVTYSSCQGRTCFGTVCLWDTSGPRFSRRHLVMGMSRATSGGKVWLA